MVWLLWLQLQLLWSSRKPIVCTYSFLMTTHIHPQVILGTRWGKYRNNNTCKFPIKLNPSSNNLSYQKTKSWKRSSFHLKLTISSFFSCDIDLIVWISLSLHHLEYIPTAICAFVMMDMLWISKSTNIHHITKYRLSIVIRYLRLQ